MGLPDNELASQHLFSAFIEPRLFQKEPEIDLEVGGIALQDPSQGLQVQTWVCRTDGENIYIHPKTTGVTTIIYTGTDITEVSLAFDSNMNYAVAFVEGGEAKFKWFDTIAADFVVTNYGPTVKNPRCTMDDKRSFNNSGRDVLLAYLKDDGGLYYREQRDRYINEYLLDAGPWTTFFNLGMGRHLRMQFILD